MLHTTSMRLANERLDFLDKKLEEHSYALPASCCNREDYELQYRPDFVTLLLYRGKVIARHQFVFKTGFNN